MKMWLLLLVAALVGMSITPAHADRAVTLPWTMNFDDNGWVSDLVLDDCEGTATHITSGCYSGGCAKITPPTSPCTAGINGGAVGIGTVTHSTTETIHIRFLIYFGSTFASNVLNGGGGTTIKFIDTSPRIGILGLHASDADGRYVAFGAMDNLASYWFRNTDPHTSEYAPFKIKDASRSQEWIAVEYWVDTTNDRTGVYLWTQDGEYSGSYIDVATTRSSGTEAFFLSYWNAYGGVDANNYYIIDNLVASSSYIGPPEGFTGGSTRKLNNVTGVRVTLH